MSEAVGQRTDGISMARLVMNVTDLDASCAFYETVSPLRLLRRRKSAEAAPDGGLRDGEVAVLADPADPAGPELHLLRWPGVPASRPYPAFYHVGFVKVCFSCPDIDAKLAQLRAAGVHPVNATIERRYTSVLDPTGVIVSFFEYEPLSRETFFHVNLSVRDLAPALGFYSDALGLTEWRASASPEPVPAAQGPGSDVSQWDSHLLRSPVSDFSLDISRIRYPGPIGRPYASRDNVGIMSLSLRTEADLAGLVSAATAAGGTVDREQAGGQGDRVMLLDPEGSRIELVGP